MSALPCSRGPTGSPYSLLLQHRAKRYSERFFAIGLKVKHKANVTRGFLLQFQLSYSDKQRYEMEERLDAQKQILVDIARKLPIYTRAQSGGMLSLQSRL